MLDLIRSSGPISRTDLAARTGLTAATMSNVARQLLEEGLIRETGLGQPKGGRPVVLLEVDNSARFAVGVQLGGESVTYVAVNLAGDVVGRIRSAGAGSNEPATMVSGIVAQIHRMLVGLGIDEERVVGIGIAAPGPLDVSSGTVLGPPHMAAWHNVPLRDLISTATGWPVAFDNDATAAALGDFWSGATEGARAHATIYLGLGLGAGVLVDGTVFRGASSNTAEIGHIVVASDAAGRPLIAEDVADPGAVVRAAWAEPSEARRLGLSGDDFGQFIAIAKAGARGDAYATRLLEASARYLGIAVTSLANMFDLDSVSLAGPGFATAGATYLRVIDAMVNRDFFAKSQHGVRVRLSPSMQDAAAVGAAALVLQSELAPRTMGLVGHST
ncbi:ROK family transcriptional regulator [Curtobacterium ammoniigenes]|uniref:ROK family transcriptional regulator n=1 Tax=Curtobacterium ammoniigenes TaxID=395387 RepID=UPI0014707633|nr:ROK family transcriptional regulator [Curtobacterium ammoniigenes]